MNRQLSHKQFYDLVEHMKRNRLEYAGKWPSEVQAACESAIGRKIAQSAIREAAAVAKVELRAQAERRPARAQLLHPVTRGDVILAREMIRLVQSLGEKPSEQLVMLAKGVAS